METATFLKTTSFVVGLILTSTLDLGAQVVSAYVCQHGSKLEAISTASIDVSGNPVIEFEDGQVVMRMKSAVVARLPMSDGGQLVMDCCNGSHSTCANEFQKEVGATGFATFYSPFQICIPDESSVQVYAPIFDNGYLMLTDETLLPAGTIVPAGTGLLLKNAGIITLSYSYQPATLTQTGSLRGSALTIPVPMEQGKTLFTLGHEATTGDYGFHAFTGRTVGAGKAYLLESLPAESGPIHFLFDEQTTTSVEEDVSALPAMTDSRKMMVDGRLLLVKGEKIYSSTGIEIR